eukprot:2082233-Pleurochrysis_carterae.AAC.1
MAYHPFLRPNTSTLPAIRCSPYQNSAIAHARRARLSSCSRVPQIDLTESRPSCCNPASPPNVLTAILSTAGASRTTFY